MKIILIRVLILSFLYSAHSAVFVDAPRLVEESGKAVITFSTDMSTDVEVGIIDVNAKVVRHLAAGVIGGTRAAPEPLQTGLSQRLEWDGLDDYGKVIYSGPFKARIRLGVTPEFERKIKPQTMYSRFFGTTNAGDSLRSIGDVIDTGHPVWHSGMSNGFYVAVAGYDMTVSDETDEIFLQAFNPYAYVYATIIRINGRTGAFNGAWPIRTNATTLFPKVIGGDTLCGSSPQFGEPVLDWHGRYLLRDEGSGCNNIYRFNLDGTPLNYANGQHIMVQPRHSGADYRQRGIASGPDGSVYHGHWRLARDTAKGTPMLYVSKYDSNGNSINEKLLQVNANIGQGIRVDLKGNIFLGVRMKPLRDTVPRHLEGRLDGGWGVKFSQRYWAQELYGSIVKFGPGGGTILADPTGDLMGASTNLYGREGEGKAVGMQWLYYGASFQATHNTGRANACWCYTPRFDVDRFGRVLFPNPFENEFVCLDNNGNMVFRVRNRDLLNSVKIGLASGVQATDRAVYLADKTNNQVVSLTWKADAEALLDVPTMAVDRLHSPSQILSITAGPNPGNGTVLIRANLSREALLSPGVSLRIYDGTGRLVADLSRDIAGGNPSIRWNGRDLSGGLVRSGVFYCRLIAGGRSVTRAITLVR